MRTFNMISNLAPHSVVNSKKKLPVDDEKNRTPGYSVFNSSYDTTNIKNYIKEKGLHENTSALIMYVMDLKK